MSIIVTSEVNPILHCNRALSSNTQYRIELMLEVIVISISNPIPLFLSIFCKLYPLIFSKIYYIKLNEDRLTIIVTLNIE